MQQLTESTIALAGELAGLRNSQNYQAALTLIDTTMEQAFSDHVLPDELDRLCLMNLLASEKGSILAEICRIVLVDEQGNTQGYAIAPDERGGILEQSLYWLQLSLASSGRAIEITFPSTNQTQPLPRARMPALLGARLSHIRSVFLAWEEIPEPPNSKRPSPVPLAQILFGQLWRTGAYDGAEDLLYFIREELDKAEPGVHTENTRHVARAFYTDLLARHDDDLLEGNLPRIEIQASEADFDPNLPGVN